MIYNYEYDGARFLSSKESVSTIILGSYSNLYIVVWKLL